MAMGIAVGVMVDTVLPGQGHVVQNLYWSGGVGSDGGLD